MSINKKYISILSIATAVLLSACSSGDSEVQTVSADDKSVDGKIQVMAYAPPFTNANPTDAAPTGFYIFDATEGFIMNFHFIIDFTDQPANQDGNLHNIVTMKRANPSPWYGVQIRHSGTSKYITLGNILFRKL